MSEPFPSLIVKLTAHDRLALRRALAAELARLAEALEAGRDWRIKTGVRRWHDVVGAYAAGAKISSKPTSAVPGQRLSVVAYATAEARLAQRLSYRALATAKANFANGDAPWGIERQGYLIKQIGHEEWGAFYDLIGDPEKPGVSDRWQALKASGVV